jgi:hypothetical protein
MFTRFVTCAGAGGCHWHKRKHRFADGRGRGRRRKGRRKREREGGVGIKAYLCECVIIKYQGQPTLRQNEDKNSNETH